MHETEVSALYDGGNNVGMLAMYHAAKAAIAKAGKHGFSLIGVTNSWMSGRSAYFVEMIARADLVTIHTASSGADCRAVRRRPPGAWHQPDRLRGADRGWTAGARYGHLGVHGDRTAIARAAWQPLPEGVAIDRDGNPTRDPAAARDGALLPFGGHKGFGLGLIVQAFGLSAAPGWSAGADGYVFITFRPDLLLPLDQLKREVSALIARVKAMPPLPG